MTDSLKVLLKAYLGHCDFTGTLNLTLDSLLSAQKLTLIPKVLLRRLCSLIHDAPLVLRRPLPWRLWLAALVASQICIYLIGGGLESGANTAPTAVASGGPAERHRRGFATSCPRLAGSRNHNIELVEDKKKKASGAGG